MNYGNGPFIKGTFLWFFIHSIPRRNRQSEKCTHSGTFGFWFTLERDFWDVKTPTRAEQPVIVSMCLHRAHWGGGVTKLVVEEVNVFCQTTKVIHASLISQAKFHFNQDSRINIKYIIHIASALTKVHWFLKKLGMWI